MRTTYLFAALLALLEIAPAQTTANSWKDARRSTAARQKAERAIWFIPDSEAARPILVTADDFALPSIVNGENLRTTILFHNLETREVEVELNFLDDDGKPAPMDLSDGTKVSSVRKKVAALGMTDVVTSGSINRTEIRWATFNAGGAKLGVLVNNEEKDSAGWRGTVYPASASNLKRLLAPYNNTEADSEIDVVNLGNETAVITVTLRDPDGKEVGKSTLRLGAMSVTAVIPADALPAGAPKKGTAELTIDPNQRGGIAVLTVRFLDAGGIEIYPSLATAP